MNKAFIGLAVGLIGSLAAITGTFLPWIEATDPADGVRLSKAGIEGHYAMVVVALAALTAGASFLLMWRRTAALAPTLIALGAVQLALEIFVGVNLARGVAQLEAAGASANLGAGLYLSGLGSTAVVAAGFLARRTQESSSALPGTSQPSHPN